MPVDITGNFVVRPETTIILALGTPALKALQEKNLAPKNRAITSLRTQPIWWNGIPVLVSYSPDIGDIDHKYYVDMLTDVGIAVRYHNMGSFKPQMGRYRYVKDFSETIYSIKLRHEVTGQPVDVMTDTETLGLDPYRLPSSDHPGAYIVTIQCTDELTFADAVAFYSREEEEEALSDPVFLEQLDFLLNCPYIRHKGANFKYDLHWFWVRGKRKLICTNFTFDTTIVGSLLDENRSNSLATHVKIYAPRLSGYSDKFDRTVDKERMDLALKANPAEFLDYACGDVDGGLEVAIEEKRQLLEDPKLAGFYVNILHPAARAFEQIEQGGILVSMDAFKELQSDLEAEQVTMITKASKIMGGRITAKHFDPSRPGGLNLTKASLLTDFMFSPMGLNLKPKMFTPKPDKDGVKRPATSLEHLLMYADNPNAKDFIGVIEEYSSVVKTYNTYVIGFLKHLRSDGRFHPTFFLYVGDQEEDEGGARTGRLSAKGPAFQTLPKHTKWAKRIRRCYIAPPGYVITERDYSQGELRVIACLAFEENMIEAYKHGLDLHLKTAAKFSGHTYESIAQLKLTDLHAWEEIRQLGKSGNFGLVFSMGTDGFVVYARKNYHVNLEWDEADNFRNGFFEDYPRLLPYHDECRKEVKANKCVRTPLGRIRHLPLIDSPRQELRAQAERQAINSPTQGTLTDLMLWSLALEHQAGLNKESPPFGVCHDSGYNYCLEDKVDLILPQQMQIMQNLPFYKVGWNPQLQFVADASVSSTNMGEMKKAA